MIFKPFYDDATSCAAYVFGCGGPAHFAGSACGAGMTGKPKTTVAFERRCNPLLALDVDAFVAQVCGAVPPKPADLLATVAWNRGR